MKRENPHMNNVHCIAHKLALCTSQAADKIPHLKQHQQILTDLFYYFKVGNKLFKWMIWHFNSFKK